LNKLETNDQFEKGTQIRGGILRFQVARMHRLKDLKANWGHMWWNWNNKDQIEDFPNPKLKKKNHNL
jgi:hypothetical protein